MSKMTMTIDEGKCIGCDVCVEECPVDAIKKEDDVYKVDEDKCILCDTCMSICPVDAFSYKVTDSSNPDPDPFPPFPDPDPDPFPPLPDPDPAPQMHKYRSGVFNGPKDISCKLGQVVWFEMKNINVIGTNVTITDTSSKQTKAIVIPAQTTVTLKFTKFGSEPMHWNFSISSGHDAFLVNYTIYSTWVPK